jgi:hypothetical protein
VDKPGRVTRRRKARIEDELAEELPGLIDRVPRRQEVIDELAYAQWPPVHEGRIATYGAIVTPTQEPESWQEPTGLTIHHRMARGLSNDATRRYADGMTSWVVRRDDATTELVVFDRLAVSERDLVIVAEASGGIVVQRHPTGMIRLVGPFGVARRTSLGWYLQPPVDHWLDAIEVCPGPKERLVLKRLLRFAVHDLGSRRVGALLIHRLGPEQGRIETSHPKTPPPLNVVGPVALAPLQHVLSQTDGAAVFAGDGTLTGLGVRLVPSRQAEQAVAPIGGTRHTNARRFSYDEPQSVVIAVSEDGPVTVFQAGQIMGRSADQEQATGGARPLQEPGSSPAGQ